MVRLRQQWEPSAVHKAVLVFDSSSRANLTMVRASALNATTSTRKDDLRLRPYQSRLEATSWPTEETLVRQPVRVLDDGKHQTGWRANTRHGPKWTEKADVTLYAEQCPAGDLSQVSQSFHRPSGPRKLQVGSIKQKSKVPVPFLTDQKIGLQLGPPQTLIFPRSCLICVGGSLYGGIFNERRDLRWRKRWISQHCLINNHKLDKKWFFF